MLLDRPVREHQTLLEQAGEVGRVVDGLGESGEEPIHLPADGLPQQLVLPARKEPVDRRPRDPRLLDDVLDGRLAHAEAGDARVRRFEDALTRLYLHAHAFMVTEARNGPAPVEGGPVRFPASLPRPSERVSP